MTFMFIMLKMNLEQQAKQRLQAWFKENGDYADRTIEGQYPRDVWDVEIEENLYIQGMIYQWVNGDRAATFYGDLFLYDDHGTELETKFNIYIELT